jgi:FkbM family methyltransferase
VIFNHHGARFFRAFGDELTDHISKGGLFEETELNFMEAFLQPGDTFWDIGANFGLYSVIAARKVGRNGSVLAFEPDPRNRRRLRLNLLLNFIGNTRIIPAAVGSEEGEVAFVSCSQGAYSGIKVAKVPGRTRNITVKQGTLDGIAARLGWPKVDFCKMDVEGAELMVCAGGRKFFEAGPRPIVMCEFSDRRTVAFDHKAAEIYSWLAERGYNWFRIAESGQLETAPARTEYDYSNLVACPGEKSPLIEPFLRNRGGSHASSS